MNKMEQLLYIFSIYLTVLVVKDSVIFLTIMYIQLREGSQFTIIGEDICEAVIHLSCHLIERRASLSGFTVPRT